MLRQRVHGILRRADIDPVVLVVPEARLPHAVIERMLAAGQAVLADPAFALHAALGLERDDQGLYAHVTRTVLANSAGDIGSPCLISRDYWIVRLRVPPSSSMYVYCARCSLRIARTATSLMPTS